MWWKPSEDGTYREEDYKVADPNEFEQYVRDRGYEYRTGYALPGFREKLGAVPSDLPEDCHIDAYVGMKSSEYLRSTKKDKPFFLWVGFYGPHHPYVPSGRFGKMYDPDKLPPFHRSDDDMARKPYEYTLYLGNKDHKFHGFTEASDETFRKMKAAYYGTVSQIDWQVGEVMKTLSETGLDENTLVVFTSDHGEFLGDHGLPAKGPFLLDCMLHVPLFIHTPGQETGTRSNQLAELVDIFPTLVRRAGLQVPDCVQGKDLGPLLPDEGSDGFQERTYIFSEAVDKRCIRDHTWKLIHYPGKSYGELYNVVEDPHELKNLWDECADQREKMIADLYRHMDSIEDFKHPGYSRFTGTDPESGEEITHYLTW